eukprot:6072509-Alexandrium_andersonii.AAC.1
MRLRPPAGPTGIKVLVPRSESADNADPEVSAPRAEGTALRAAPPAHGATTEQVPVFRGFQALGRDVTP